MLDLKHIRVGDRIRVTREGVVSSIDQSGIQRRVWFEGETRSVSEKEEEPNTTVEVLKRPFAVGDKIRLPNQHAVQAIIRGVHDGRLWIQRTDAGWGYSSPYTTTAADWEHDPGA